MIREKQSTGRPVLDLTGPQGNAFALLGATRQYIRDLRRAGIGGVYHEGEYLALDEDKILEEMRSGDYEHLVQTMDKYLGDFIILER